MNKKELVEKLAKEGNITQKVASKFVNAFINSVGNELASGGSVRLVGFGSFTVRMNAARKGVDPRTKAPIQIPAKRVPKFVPGKDLKERVK